jgi:hypothetical protein
MLRLISMLTMGLAMLTTTPADMARVVAGETPGCSFEAKVAAVQVAANRAEAGIQGGWFGDAEPGPLDVLAVTWADRLPDVVGDALYFIGPGDAGRMPWLRERTGRWVCAGTWVESWR